MMSFSRQLLFSLAIMSSFNYGFSGNVTVSMNVTLDVTFLSDVLATTADKIAGIISGFKMEETVDENHVFFVCYFKNTSTPAVISASNASQCLNATAPVKLIIHGYNSSVYSQWTLDLAKSLVETCDCNVIGVDWSAIAGKPYVIAAQGIKGVALIIVKFLKLLSSTLTVLTTTLHIVAHSLGAHCCYYVSKGLDHPIYKITALDPDRIFFEFPYVGIGRLSKECAQYVDVMHTDPGKWGVLDAYGTVDYYVDVELKRNFECTTTGTCHGFKDLECYRHNMCLGIYNRSITLPEKAVGTPCLNAALYLLGACNFNKKVTFGYWVQQNVTGNVYCDTDVPLS